MDRRWIGIALLLLALSAAVPLVIRISTSQRERKPDVVQALTVDAERALRITARPVPPLMGPRVGLYYELVPADQAAATQPAATQPDTTQNANNSDDDAAFFGTLPVDREPPRFVLHHTEDGELLAVAPATDPKAVLILYDLSSGESWPRHGELEGVKQFTVRGQQFMHRFKVGRSDTGFRLVPGTDIIRPLDELVELKPASTQPAQTRPAGE